MFKASLVSHRGLLTRNYEQVLFCNFFIKTDGQL